LLSVFGEVQVTRLAYRQPGQVAVELLAVAGAVRPSPDVREGQCGAGDGARAPQPSPADRACPLGLLVGPEDLQQAVLAICTPGVGRFAGLSVGPGNADQAVQVHDSVRADFRPAARIDRLVGADMTELIEHHTSGVGSSKSRSFDRQ
jgi:hypothetical protein